MSLESDLNTYRKTLAYIDFKRALFDLIQAAEADPSRRAYLRNLYEESRTQARQLAVMCAGSEMLEIKALIDPARVRLTELGVIQP